jgi:hypothetical protein
LSHTISQALLHHFEGKLLRIDRWADPTVGGYKVGLVLHVPDDLAQDEMEVYRRVAKVVHLITTEKD